MALALSDLPQIDDSRIIVGRNTADDAGVFRFAPDRALVHTVDLLAPVVDDPYTYGRIAAVNSLSDIYAMGGKPLVALNVIGFPANLDVNILGDILRGGQDEMLEAGGVVLGGHTFQSAEIMYGLALTGEISPDQIFTNDAAKPGNLLVLTKALGTGALIQAMMTRGVVTESLYNQAVSSMTVSNRIAADLMIKHKAQACTDITGFGFLGHTWEMAEASNVGIDIWAEKLPVFPKILDLIRDGVTDSGVQMNRNSFENNVDFAVDLEPEYAKLLFGSETSGGLLIAIDEKEAEKLVVDLRDVGLEESAIVGMIVAEHPGRLTVLL